MAPTLRLLILLSSMLRLCYAAKNVTLDDNDAQIQYSIGWSVSDKTNELNYGGFHHLTDRRTATASFTFTGTAVYVMSPKWPYNVAAQISVDSKASTFVDLRDYSRDFDSQGGPETVDTAVVWGVVRLNNTQHTLHVTFAENKDWLVLDALIYTEEEEELATDSEDIAERPSESNAPGSSSINALAVGLGVGLSIAGLVLMFAAFFLYRRRREVPSVEYTRSIAPQYSGSTWLVDSQGGSMYAFEPLVLPSGGVSAPFTTVSSSRGGSWIPQQGLYDPYGGATLSYDRDSRFSQASSYQIAQISDKRVGKGHPDAVVALPEDSPPEYRSDGGH